MAIQLFLQPIIVCKKVNYVAGMKREYGYDAADRVANITNTINQTDKQRFDYEYDENSNRKKETQSLQGTPRKVLNFTHDLADRLTQTKETTPAPNTQPAPSQTINVTETSSLKGHSYDAVGNRLTEATQTETVGIRRVANAQGTVTETRGTPQLSGVQNATAKFDELNRLYELTEPSGVSNLTYDNNGNLQTVSKNGTTQQQFEYDPRDQLRKVKDSVNTEIASFDYDSERRRVSKITNGASVYPEHYVYAGDKVVAEYTGITDYEITKAKYSLGANEIVKANFTQNNEGEKYYFSDALGSTTALASANATATQKYDYDSWGKSSVVQNLPSNNAIGYTGQRLDNETGLMALGNGERYYSPTLARFIQQDSFTGSLTNGQSLNRFAYGLNNPLKFIDPSGNEGLVAEKIQTTLLKNGSNTGNETVDWWLNFGASFNAGFTYDAFNFMTAGLAGAADVMAKDAMNGKTTSFGDAWMRNGYSASTSQIATNFLYYGAGVGQGIKNVAKSLPAIGYGLLTNPSQTLGMMGSGIKESLSNGAYYAFNPRAGLDELAQNSQEEIAFGVGETVGEAVAAEGVGAVAGKAFGIVGKALGRTKIGSAVAKVFTEAGSKIGVVRQGIKSFESRAFSGIKETTGKFSKGFRENALKGTYAQSGGLQNLFDGIEGGINNVLKKPSLLEGEGLVGTYQSLKNAGRIGDNLTPHHIPSDGFMQNKVSGYTRNQGISINMEQPRIGGRHRSTSSYGRSPDLSLTARDALAREVWDARRVFKADNLYTPEIRRSLLNIIEQNKTAWGSVFEK